MEDGGMEDGEWKMENGRWGREDGGTEEGAKETGDKGDRRQR